MYVVSLHTESTDSVIGGKVHANSCPVSTCGQVYYAHLLWTKGGPVVARVCGLEDRMGVPACATEGGTAEGSATEGGTAEGSATEGGTAEGSLRTAAGMSLMLFVRS